MRVQFTRSAAADVDECVAWWRENRPDAPGLVGIELDAALEHLTRHGTTLPVFRRVAGEEVRRVLLPRTRRHL